MTTVPRAVHSRHFRHARIGAALLAITALSCGEVPTLENGIAYLDPVVLPAPAVVVGDQLRDSTGAVAPLRVRAVGRNGEAIDAAATFLPTILPAPVTIDANGIVTAGDTAGSVQLVARVGSSLQTTPVTLLIVPQPTTAAATSAVRDSVTVLPALDTMRVSISGSYRGSVAAVAGVIVRYRIEQVYATGSNVLAVLQSGTSTPSRSDPTFQTAVDTTDASGLASRVLAVSGTGVDSVVVSASARDFRGAALPTLRFVLRVRP